jgi:predicted PhzF superfamily epimerase YddE/YHI9
MRLPAYRLEPHALSAELARALGDRAPNELHRGRSLVAVWDDPDVVRNVTLGDLAPLIEAGGGSLIITAGGPRAAPYDIVSRFFAPGYGIPEDPVTGSAHSTLVPFWAKRLGKKTLRAWQASARGGELLCTDEGDRVLLSGSCALYLRGEIEV